MTEIEFMRRFGNNLRDVLEDCWMTQKELSEETGISESTISRYVRGEMMPTFKNIVNIKYALNCEWDELVDFDGRII